MRKNCRFVSRIIISIIIVLSGISSASANDCKAFKRVGMPSNSDQMLCRDGFLVGYSYEHKGPEWVMYPLTKQSVTGYNKRKDYFSEDHEIPYIYRALLSDFKHSGYDRGHLAPNAAMDFTVNSQKQSFKLSNISPQHPDLNQKGWRSLEDKLRECAIESDNGLFVVTGSIFKHPIKYIGNRVAVPSGFYKAVLERQKPYRMSAWVMPNKLVDQDNIDEFLVPVSRIEKSLGIDLFSGVPEEWEEQHEDKHIDICQLG